MYSLLGNRACSLWVGTFCCFWQFVLLGQGEINYQLQGNERLLVIGKTSNGDPLSYKEVHIYVGDSITVNRTSIVGNYFQKLDTLVFEPYFPFRYGLVYSVFIEDELRFQFRIPYPEEIVAPELKAIFPSTDTLPANLLKFYFHFSQPMSEGFAYRSVRIVTEEGDTLVDPIVQLQPELWDNSRQRLTLWLDPGQIKRGLQSNTDNGTPLQPGKFHFLYVDAAWKSTFGLSLQKTVSKTFFVEPADRLQPDIAEWDIVPPRSRTRRPLLIRFNEPLDHALLQNTITVLDDEDVEIAGLIQVSNREKEWQFIPKETWKRGYYKIRVNTRLEDLAGNNLNRLFDTDLEAVAEQDSMQDEVYKWYDFRVY